MTLSSADFELLLQANRILSSKLDVDDVLMAVMELATKIVRAEASSLLLLDAKANELYFNVALGTVGERVKEIRMKVGEGIAGWVAKSRQPLVVNDVSKDPRFTKRVDQSTQFQTHSIIAVPLLSRGVLVGVVEAINKEHGASFSSQDLEVFEMFAGQAAVALENARLFSEVRREKNKLDTVFSEMSEGVLSISEDGRIAFMNSAAEKVLGIKEEEGVSQIFSPALFPLFEMTPHFQSLADFHEKITSLEMHRKEGKELLLDVQVHHFLHGINREEDGWLVIIADKTEEKREEKIKRNFLSLISHKLKTPLTVILGYAPLLQSSVKGLSELQQKAIESIIKQGEHLGELVDKLLHFALVESESVKSTLGPHSISVLIEESLEYFNSTIKELRVEVRKSIPQNLPMIDVDETLATGVLKNLVENAIKFNNSKQKLLTFQVDVKNDFLWVTVGDNGQGIPPEEQQKVFQKFYQVENYFTGQIPGAGLGLAYCKKVIEGMGGKISLESELKKGTNVSVSFPLSSGKP